MEDQLRRLLPRDFADWQGKLMIEGESPERWRECRVIDISSASHLNRKGRLRVGTEFVDLSAEEQAYLTSLRELQAHW